MKKIDKHIPITESNDNKLKASCKRNKRSYSEEVNYVIEEYYKERDELIKLLYSLAKDMKFISKKQNIVFELIKQIYSDMDFKNIKNPKNSYALNEFFKNIRSDKFDD
jgi:trans-2-enoyl-CoA reductase